MEHDINLNIHYSAPEEIWEKISSVYRSMPYWDGSEPVPHWCGDDIDLYASVEPGGIQISGTMPENIWNEWYSALKNKLSDALGYEIGEPEEGFPFKYWEPFEKKHSDIKSLDSKEIVFNDYSTFCWEDFERIDRDNSAKDPCLVCSSKHIELRIYFEKGLSKRKTEQCIKVFLAKLNSLGVQLSGLSKLL